MVPVIVGVADVKNRSTRVEDAKEPAQLMLEAINLAIQDTNSSAGAQKLTAAIDSVSVVQSWTWPYKDLPGLLSDKLGARPRHKLYTEVGGNQPVRLLDEIANRISSGESNLAVLTGGEALASLTSCIKHNQIPTDWTESSGEFGSIFSPTTRKLKDDLGGIHSIGAPIHVYPLYENGFRAHRNQSVKENNQESAEMYATFSRVAAEQNQYAWDYGQPAHTAKEIGTVYEKNRMICFPYPLLMNAFNTVNLSAACILTSTEYAKKLGIPESKWIYPLSAAGDKDSEDFWNRPNFHSSPAIAYALDQTLTTAGLSKNDIDLFDFYSCFPIVPKLACHHLGLDITNPAKPITLLGGLTSFGGAGNNYSMHAITEMTRQLRKGNGRNGLILANGGVVSYEHALCLSSQPRTSSYPDNRLTAVGKKPKPLVDAQAEGPAVIETYTVEFNRNGTPSLAFVVGRLKDNGHRFVANHGDDQTLNRLASSTEEPIGKSGFVRSEKTKDGVMRNLFVLDRARL